MEQVRYYRERLREVVCGEVVCKSVGKEMGGFVEDRILTETQKGLGGRGCSNQWLVLRGDVK